MPPGSIDGLAAANVKGRAMDTNKQAHAAMTHAEKLKYLEERSKEQERLQTIKFDLTEQEQKEREEHIKIYNLPF